MRMELYRFDPVQLPSFLHSGKPRVSKLPLEKHNELSIMEDSYPKHQDQHDREEKRIMRLYFTSIIFNRFMVVALILALVGSAWQVTPVYAASIVVNSNLDSV